MPTLESRRRSKTPLRGSRQRHADRVRARVRRRLAQLGAADALFQPQLPLHHLQRARLSALGCPRERRELFAGALARGHARRGRWPRSSTAPHVVGLSMGAFATLHFGMEYCAKGRPAEGALAHARGRGLGRASGHVQGSSRKMRARTPRTSASTAWLISPTTYGHGAARIQFQNKDPRGFAEYNRQLAEHSAAGSANTMAGYQGRRPCLYDLTDEIARIDVPVLIMAGDEDEPCIEASVLLKRAIPRAGLALLAKIGTWHQCRRARALQPAARGFPPPGRGRQLGRARSARRAAIDLGPGG